VLTLGLGPALALTGKVFQGTCVSFDEGKSVMVLKNDKNERDKNPVDKNLVEVSFDLTDASMGMRPSPGDKIRISFVEKDGKFCAHKVMNVTKQNLFKK